jgi:hypothetical protein
MDILHSDYSINPGRLSSRLSDRLKQQCFLSFHLVFLSKGSGGWEINKWTWGFLVVILVYLPDPWQNQK